VAAEHDEDDEQRHGADHRDPAAGEVPPESGAALAGCDAPTDRAAHHTERQAGRHARAVDTELSAHGRRRVCRLTREAARTVDVADAPRHELELRIRCAKCPR